MVTAGPDGPDTVAPPTVEMTKPSEVRPTASMSSAAVVKPTDEPSSTIENTLPFYRTTSESSINSTPGNDVGAWNDNNTIGVVLFST